MYRPTRRVASYVALGLALSLAACGGGGAGGGAAAPEGTVGSSAPTPSGATLTYEGRFGILVAGAETMVAIVLTSTAGDVFRFEGLAIEPGDLWEEPAPGVVVPGTYLVRTYGASGWTYARMFTFLPGLAEAPYVSNGNLELEPYDPDVEVAPRAPF